MTIQLRPYQQRILEDIQNHNKGIIVIPTGGGKTLVFMEDLKRRILNSTKPLTAVIIAPKILLSSQLYTDFQKHLKEIKNILYTNVHSGEDGTTNVEMIQTIHRISKVTRNHHLIFTTYKSLPKVNDSNVQIDVAIFDEAHYSVTESNFVGVAQTAQSAKNSFFYTATPKHTESKTTMANSDVYGGTIISIPPKELVNHGYILPPVIRSYESSEYEDENILNFVDEIQEENPKILVAVSSVQSMMDLFTETDLLSELESRNFNILHITSKYGCIVNRNKVSRQEFFDELNQIGNDDEQKLIVFHHSTISEGISVNGMSHCLLLRNLTVVDYVQTIGRILRLHHEDSKKLQSGLIQPGEYHKYKKPFGVIAYPSKDSRGNKIERKLQSIVNHLFIEGETLIA